MVKIGSLFDGSGGFPLAGTICGITPAWASEIEPYPISVTKARFPAMKHLGSVTDINGAEIEPVDIITFGSPCQDLSVAGKRAGLKHEANGDDETTRSGLFMEAVRIIKEMREATNGLYPNFALWENVPGAFSSNKGEDFRTVLAELINIVEPGAVMPPVPKAGWAYADSYTGDGWSLAYRVFDAQYWGVPQRRRRIHLVLDLRGERARKVLFEREGVRGYFETCGAPGQGAAADAERGAGADDREGEVGCLNPWDAQGNRVISADGIAPVLRGGGTGSNGYPAFYVCYPGVAHALTARHDGAPQPDKGNGANIVVQAAAFKAGNGALIQTDKSATLATNNDQYLFQHIPIHDQATRFAGKRGDKSDGKGNGLGVGQAGDPMNTLTSADRHAVVYAVSSKQQSLVTTEGCANTLGANDFKEPQTVAYLASGKEATGTLMASMATKQCLGDQEAFSGDYHIVEERDAEVYRQGGFADYIEGEVGTLRAAGGDLGGGSENLIVNPKPLYIVRRLTPTECARLQGFADRWGDIDEKADFTDEEYSFWLNVRNTHAAINGKQVKEYTKAQMLTWYNKLHTDGAEYKMWGNGIALPTALYCMQGIVDALNREEDDSWLL